MDKFLITIKVALESTGLKFGYGVEGRMNFVSYIRTADAARREFILSKLKVDLRPLM